MNSFYYACFIATLAVSSQAVPVNPFDCTCEVTCLAAGDPYIVNYEGISGHWNKDLGTNTLFDLETSPSVGELRFDVENSTREFISKIYSNDWSFSNDQCEKDMRIGNQTFIDSYENVQSVLETRAECMWRYGHFTLDVYLKYSATFPWAKSSIDFDEFMSTMNPQGLCFTNITGGKPALPNDFMIKPSCTCTGTAFPTEAPTSAPTFAPTSGSASPTSAPTFAPTSGSASPTESPTTAPTSGSASPTESPTTTPTSGSASPTSSPTFAPTSGSASPTSSPTFAPTSGSASPTGTPTQPITSAPSTKAPSAPLKTCSCSATCNAVADPHITTFEGEHFVAKVGRNGEKIEKFNLFTGANNKFIATTTKPNAQNRAWIIHSKLGNKQVDISRCEKLPTPTSGVHSVRVLKQTTSGGSWSVNCTWAKKINPEHNHWRLDVYANVKVCTGLSSADPEECNTMLQKRKPTGLCFQSNGAYAPIDSNNLKCSC